MGAAGAIGLAWVPGIAAAARTRILGGTAFGTYWRLTVPSGLDVRPIRALVADIIATIDRALSPFDSGSEISRFNDLKSTEWMTLGADATRVVHVGLRVAGITGGAFDPTVGPIVGRYGFGPIKGRRVGSYRNITARGTEVRKDHPLLSFDPCGIAKGYALDRITARLDGLGVPGYLAELGGEAFARGLHPDGRPWQVGIERPGPGALALQRIVRLPGMALATSGDSVNAYAIGDRRYSHIIDPRESAPVANDVTSVSVIARRAITADALATGLMAMGAKKGLAFAERNRIPVLYLLRGKGGLREMTSSAFSAYVMV